MTTARFKDLVARVGRPEVHLSWSGPAKDAVLQEAAKANRLLSVHQNTRGGKKDHGEVGLHAGRDVQYLLFPKSLRAFAGKRIVGIDYDALGGELSASAPAVTKRAKKASAAPKAERGKADNKIVAFEPPSRPAARASTPTPTPRKKAKAARPRGWVSEVSDAVAEIREGKVSTGLARLEELLAAQGKGS